MNMHRDASVIRQAKFAAFQAAKILHHYGYNSWDDFMGRETSRTKRKVPELMRTQTMFSRTPAVFQYYIVKSAFLWQPDAFKKAFPLNEISKCNSKTVCDLEKFLLFPGWIKVINFLLTLDLVSFANYKTMRMTLDLESSKFMTNHFDDFHFKNV